MNTARSYNDENVPHLIGKVQNFQQSQRQPLGTRNVANIELNKAKSVVPEKIVVGVITRSQTAKLKLEENTGLAKSVSDQEFKIYEDVPDDNAEVNQEFVEVEEKVVHADSVMTCEKAVPNDFNGSEEEEEECDQEIDAENNMEGCDDIEECEDGDLTIIEELDDDSEMLNALRKQKANEDDVYAEKHKMYSMIEYRNDIYRNLRAKEAHYMPNPYYMQKQEIEESCRSNLVDLMISKVDKMRLKRETLFLAVNYFDRFMSSYRLKKSQCEILAGTALFIAAKYEEVITPSIDDFVHSRSQNCKRGDIQKYEKCILKALNFEMNVPTANFFCLDLLNQFSLSCTEYALAFYLLEMSLIFGNGFMRFFPSVVAASCVLLAVLDKRKINCIEKITLRTGYTMQDLSSCVGNMARVIQLPVVQTFLGIRNRYNDERYNSVSKCALQKDLNVENLFARNF